jgi:predicted nucleic acid-binding protein
MVALDTNIVIDLGLGTVTLAESAARAIESLSSKEALVICGVVYAELCASPMLPRSEIDAVLRSSQIAIDDALPRDLWAEAGAAYGAFARRRKSSAGALPRRILADFIIGAHATAVGSLVTRDGDFFKRVFPNVRVVDARDYARS